MSQRGAVVGVHHARGALLGVLTLLGLLCCCCGESFGGVPDVTLTTAPLFVQIEEFVPGTAHVNAEFYAFLNDPSPGQPTTVTLQYVDAAGYVPEAGDPYAAGVTIVVASTSATRQELHTHLVLEPDQLYHYRIVASNSAGTFETPDATVQTYPASQGVLPDARAYEQVSPVDKNHVDALGDGEYMSMQASAAGSSFAYFSYEPFPVAVGTSTQTTEYLSTRSSSPAAWSTQGVQPPIDPIGSLHGERDEVTGFTEDLARTLVEVPGPPLSPPGVVDAFLRNNTNGTFQLLATDVGSGRVNFADATPDDSRILFETEHQLLSAAVAGKKNLYEWDETKPEGKRLALAGVLPNGEAPPNGSGAGQGGSEQVPELDQPYLQNTISADGSKVFFTAHPSDRIYERQPLSEPLPLTVPVSLGAATFLAATPSGQYVFYSEGTELYRFDTSTETSQALTSGAEDVLGSLGVSDDGAYAYFVAHGVLAPNQNANGEEAVEGADNLYEWHEDSTTSTVTTTFIARLLGGDEPDWYGANDNFNRAPEGKTSRLTPNGTALLFMSEASLTHYDNSGCVFW